MAFTRKSALRAAAAMAAAGAAVTNGVDATPVAPTTVEEVIPPVSIVEEVKTPDTEADSLYNQIDAAMEAMENGETPSINISGSVTLEPDDIQSEMTGGSVTILPEEKEPEMTGGSVTLTPDEKKPVMISGSVTLEPEDIPSEVTGGSVTILPEEKEPEMTGGTVILDPVVEEPDAITGEADTEPEVDKTPVKEPGKAPMTGTPAPEVTVDKTPVKEPGKAPMTGTPAPEVTVPNTPVVSQPKPEDKFSANANWASETQKNAVKDFLDKHPDGTVWDDYTTYRNTAGCAAYAFALQDIAYGQNVKYMTRTDNAYDIRQYDVVDLGGHFVFVLEVLPEQDAIVVAQGNYNGKTSNYDVVDMSMVQYCLRPRGI